MNIVIIGLGRMGSAIAMRLKQAGYAVYGIDANVDVCRRAAELGIEIIPDISESAHYAISLFWLMVPAGNVVDQLIAQIVSHAPASSIVIDGGNSHFSDSIRRANLLQKQGFHFVDCGTSGGLHGQENGFCLMVGADKNIYQRIELYLAAVAMKNGYARVGNPGSGHYVKMVHNGIEYALLQAYAEGFHLLKQGYYPDLDLHQIASLWQHGSIVRSWILHLMENILKEDQNFENVSGSIAESGTGAWTVDEAHARDVPVEVIEKALAIRAWSRESGGNYATILVALLRNAFGGHVVQKGKI